MGRRGRRRRKPANKVEERIAKRKRETRQNRNIVNYNEDKLAKEREKNSLICEEQNANDLISKIDNIQQDEKAQLKRMTRGRLQKLKNENSEMSGDNEEEEEEEEEELMQQDGEEEGEEEEEESNNDNDNEGNDDEDNDDDDEESGNNSDQSNSNESDADEEEEESEDDSDCTHPSPIKKSRNVSMREDELIASLEKDGKKGRKLRGRVVSQGRRLYEDNEASESSSKEPAPKNKRRSTRPHRRPNPVYKPEALKSTYTTSSKRINGFSDRRKKKSRRRRHKIDSSDSSNSSSSDESSFQRSESKRYKKELNAITPLNSSSMNKANQRDVMRSDAAAVHVDPTINWESIGGLGEHVKTLKEMILMPLLYPEVFDRFQVAPPKGVLFVGPPGTGKTLVARALANCCSVGGKQVSFFMRKGADCLSKWVGEAEKQMRLLFEQARLHEPSIIFFDEIDGLAPVRSSKQDQIHSSIVATMLALMDGVDTRGQVIVIGATNRVDAIDPALRRPGRFDRELFFSLPDQKGRREILDIHTKKWTPQLTPMFKDAIASRTIGYCGADLRALCTEAALNSLKRNYPQIYTNNKRLKLNLDNVYVSEVDFQNALVKVVPCSQRQAERVGKPLDSSLRHLLQPALKSCLSIIHRQFPLNQEQWKDWKRDSLCLPPCGNNNNNNLNNNDTMLSNANTPSSSSNTPMDSLLKSASDSNNTDQAADHLSRLYRPRLLIKSSQDNGQVALINAILHSMEGFPSFCLDLEVIQPLLSTDYVGADIISAMLSRIQEAKKQQPAIVYITDFVHWFEQLNPVACASIIKALGTGPILFMTGINDTDASELEHKDEFFQLLQLCGLDEGSSVIHRLHSLLNGGNNIAEIGNFKAEERKGFFEFISDELSRPINQQVGIESVEVEELEEEEVPKAPLLESDEEIIETMQRDLRLFLKEVLKQLSKDKANKHFCTPVDVRDVEDYYEVIKKPMCFQDMFGKVNDHRYECFEDFMRDIARIAKNAYEYNGEENGGRSIVHAANALDDVVRDMADNFLRKMKAGKEYFQRLKTFVERKRGAPVLEESESDSSDSDVFDSDDCDYNEEMPHVPKIKLMHVMVNDIAMQSGTWVDILESEDSDSASDAEDYNQEEEEAKQDSRGQIKWFIAPTKQGSQDEPSLPEKAFLEMINGSKQSVLVSKLSPCGYTYDDKRLEQAEIGVKTYPPLRVGQRIFVPKINSQKPTEPARVKCIYTSDGLATGQIDVRAAARYRSQRKLVPKSCSLYEIEIAPPKKSTKGETDTPNEMPNSAPSLKRRRVDENETNNGENMDIDAKEEDNKPDHSSNSRAPSPTHSLADITLTPAVNTAEEGVHTPVKTTPTNHVDKPIYETVIPEFSMDIYERVLELLVNVSEKMTLAELLDLRGCILARCARDSSNIDKDSILKELEQSLGTVQSEI